ncbi:uncharacterized protein LOC118480887 isoform X2 [Helianthus annuus]|uniref:uncharacterized protein LOC118480887 isoform X2 n=1 Tax=Helianthus annuus TaxID=4232 RepID=UPI00165310C8|nr:uncharacterized protein LOC118480887 isoform X2 [Helianthus annuus]
MQPLLVISAEIRSPLLKFGHLHFTLSWQSRHGHTRGIGPKPCSSTSRIVSDEESQTPQFSKALFQSWFQNPDFRNELQNFLSSSYPTKFGSEDVDGEEADDGSDDDMDMI